MSDILTKIIVALIEKGAMALLNRKPEVKAFTLEALAAKEMSRGLKIKAKLAAKQKELKTK